MIKRYLEYKIDDRLFDRTIAAYKARGKQIEPMRKTYEITLRDLKNCARLSENVDICFVDDLEHRQMKHRNIFYIHIPAYHHNFEPVDIENDDLVIVCGREVKAALDNGKKTTIDGIDYSYASGELHVCKAPKLDSLNKT